MSPNEIADVNEAMSAIKEDMLQDLFESVAAQDTPHNIDKEHNLQY